MVLTFTASRSKQLLLTRLRVVAWPSDSIVLRKTKQEQSWLQLLCQLCQVICGARFCKPQTCYAACPRPQTWSALRLKNGLVKSLILQSYVYLVARHFVGSTKRKGMESSCQSATKVPWSTTSQPALLTMSRILLATRCMMSQSHRSMKTRS